MPNPKSKKDFVSDITDVATAADTPTVMADLKNIVHKAVAAAVAVIRQKFSQRLSVLKARLKAIKTKLVDMESIGAAQSSADDGSLARKLEAVKRMSRDSALQANDNEQYSRRNNLRIKGLEVEKECTAQECVTAVVEVFRSQMHSKVDSENIDIAHPVKRKATSASDGDQQRSRSRVTEPVVLVRCHSRVLRNSVIQKRKILKGSKYAVSEDLTGLNVQPLNRLNSNDQVQKNRS